MTLVSLFLTAAVVRIHFHFFYSGYSSLSIACCVAIRSSFCPLFAQVTPGNNFEKKFGHSVFVKVETGVRETIT